MPRPKRPTVQTFTPGPSDAARAELWEGIDLLLVLANLHKDDPSDDARKVHHVLTQISEAADRWYEGDRRPMTFELPGRWPAGAVLAVSNLIAIIRQGVPRLYVRRCPECREWRLTEDKRLKRKCHRAECFKAAESRRSLDWQRDEKRKDAEAFERVRQARTR